ncbi:MAG: hypothetical protein JNM78_10780 [Cyclobacteriaceae bacterium]|nr:hypothetical protein [Cyclobacteriaceae bacterium]
MIRRNQIILVLITVSCLVVIILYWVTLPNRNLKNGFTRMIHATVQPAHSIPLGRGLYDFAGVIGERCYLYQVAKPDRLLEIYDGNLTDTLFIHNPFDQSRAAEIKIAFPFFYWSDLSRYRVYTGSITHWNLTEEFPHPTFYAEYLPTPSGVLYRPLNPEKDLYQLAKHTHADTIEGVGLLEKQLDGLFCTDGMLRFDEETDQVVYIYFYRNEFICAGTMLTLLYRGHTIDTTSRARISVGSHGGYHTLSSPPHLVNRLATAYQGKLFVNSNLIADNEQPADFSRADVIDVYNLTSGAYGFSFYLPRLSDDRITRFTLFEDGLYALYPDALVTYKFDHSIQSKLNSMRL